MNNKRGGGGYGNNKQPERWGNERPIPNERVPNNNVIYVPNNKEHKE
jgi:hypothetical protein